MPFNTSDTKFIKESDGRLTLRYRTDNYSWIQDKFSENEPIRIRGVFYFTVEDLQNKSILNSEQGFEPSHISDFEKEFHFTMGKLEDNYYRIDGRIINITHNLFFHQDIKIEEKIFSGSGRVPIFPIIDKITLNDMYIGGGHESALPYSEFEKLAKEFPNQTEVNKYKLSRITAIIKDYYNIRKDYQTDYENYLNKKKSIKGVDMRELFRKQEIAKYTAIKCKLEDMLSDQTKYNEHQWQYEILEIILLLFPKYIKVFAEVPVKDCYSDKKRRLDYMVVDAVGNIDIIEIKKPGIEKIISVTTYRDNYIPIKELSGTVMQIEKYILYLNKWGSEGEKYLTERYKDKLPAKINLQITNPSGIIIMGRTAGLNNQQLRDFEVLKRKYKNVMDIITYDDLIKRLDMIINQFSGESIVQTS